MPQPRRSLLLAAPLLAAAPRRLPAFAAPRAKRPGALAFGQRVRLSPRALGGQRQKALHGGHARLEAPAVTALDGQGSRASRRWLATGVGPLVGLLLAARRRGGRAVARHAEDEDSPAQPAAAPASGFKKLATTFCNLFAVWLALVSIVGLKAPASFTWIRASDFTLLLGMLMFSVGITTTLKDFRACLNRPLAIAINFLLCYGLMPLLAYVIGRMINAEGAILAGLVLVGATNGGQASNLCTLIAGGDVALSVLMTTSTTLGCILMTPLICKLVLGAVVPVNAMGIVISTIQVVLAPIFLGVLANTLAPKACKAITPYTPVVGVIATVVLVGASVAKCADEIMLAGIPLQVGALMLHVVGGLFGFFAVKMVGYDERTCRTVAIETAMKSNAFSFLLASLHFGDFNVRVPAAVGVVWMAIAVSLLAVYWRGKPPAVA